jgi:hypothetical protein
VGEVLAVDTGMDAVIPFKVSHVPNELEGLTPTTSIRQARLFVGLADAADWFAITRKPVPKSLHPVLPLGTPPRKNNQSPDSLPCRAALDPLDRKPKNWDEWITDEELWVKF